MGLASFSFNIPNIKAEPSEFHNSSDNCGTQVDSILLKLNVLHYIFQLCAAFIT